MPSEGRWGVFPSWKRGSVECSRHALCGEGKEEVKEAREEEGGEEWGKDGP